MIFIDSVKYKKIGVKRISETTSEQSARPLMYKHDRCVNYDSYAEYDMDKRARKDLVLSRKTIPWTSSYRYPGVILCDDLSMKTYVQAAIAKVSKTAGIFKHLSPSFGAFPLDERILVYKTVIRCLEYALGDIALTAAELNVPEKKQNEILRWLFAVPAHTPIEMLLQTTTQRQVSLACRRDERYKWSEMFNKGPRLPCHAVFAAQLEV
jgi:hypothetical protein